LAEIFRGITDLSRNADELISEAANSFTYPYFLLVAAVDGWEIAIFTPQDHLKQSAAVPVVRPVSPEPLPPVQGKSGYCSPQF
jgi:PIN domain nuclease of toxin-antitoxin system